jgi:hypothetical protein
MPTAVVSVQNNTIQVFKQDSLTVRCTVKKTPSGDIVDLTSYSAKLSVKIYPYDNDADAMFIATGTISSPTTGVITFALTSANTDQRPGNYYYDVQIINGTTIKTVAAGKFVIAWDVTRATS